MAFKHKELKEMRKVMNSRLEQVKDSYSSFTPLERVHFVQQAFYDVNAYCSRLWGYDRRDVAFGFMIGRNSTASTFTPKGTTQSAICYNLKAASIENNPFRVYEVLFHEFKHVNQARSFTPASKIGNVFYPASYQKNQTHARWLASPIEMEADNFAIKSMQKITKTGFLKSLFRVKPCKEEAFYKGSKVMSALKHLSGVGSSIIENVKALFGGTKISQKPIIGKVKEEGMRVFNLREVNFVMNTLPYKLTDVSKLKGTPFRDWVKDHHDLAHTPKIFFGANRVFNQVMNRRGLENGTNEFDLGRLDVDNATKEAMAKSLFVATQPKTNVSFIQPQFSQNEDIEADSKSVISNNNEECELANETTQSGFLKEKYTLKDEIISHIVAERESLVDLNQEASLSQTENGNTQIKTEDRLVLNESSVVQEQ